MITPLNIALAIIALALAGVIAALVRLESRLNNVLRGKKAKDLEEVMIALGNHIDKLEDRYQAIENHLVNVEKRLRRSLQHVHTIRFNPFKDQGGNQSFATAFLNEGGDGVVISSLYSRDKVSVYAKPLSGTVSEYELSAEEQAAIDQAQQQAKE